jgi:ABC-2 type transport system ATP-binding protein
MGLLKRKGGAGMHAATEVMPAAGDPAVRLAGLTKSFGSFRAVDGLDLTIDRGELFSLLGPNGAGKTTTIKMMCCLLRPTSGSVSILGHDIAADPIAVKRLIAVAPQETAIAEHLTASENLMLMASLHGRTKRDGMRRTAELLEMLALQDRAGDRVKKFSGGMKRRLSIAMALVSDPKVLFLDEPTIGLDPQSRRGMWEHIELLKGDTTIVLTTHYLEEADALADRIGIVDEGRLIALGTSAELKGDLGAQATVVEAIDLTDDSLIALRELYPVVNLVDGGVEIEGADVRLREIEDCLRPRGVITKAIYEKHVTLDDVFLDLTGKELRE